MNKTYRVKDAIWADDRRVEQQECFTFGCLDCFPNWKERRTTPHDYSKPQRHLLVPVDPQPPSGYGLHGIPFGHVIFMERNYKTVVPTLKCADIHRVRVPYQKDDILAFGEDRKVKVEQVLGVEAMEIYHDVNDNHYIEKLLHYRLLVSEKEEEKK